MRIFSLASLMVSSFLFVCSPQPVGECQNQNKNIRQDMRILLIGGGKISKEIRDKFVELSGGEDARIVVIPSANNSPCIPSHVSAWSDYNFSSLKVLHFSSVDDANDLRFCKIIKEATGIWFSGGDQSCLSDLLKNTKAEKELKALASRGVIMAGTSAGASFFSEVMISGNHSCGHGLGLLENIMVDQHFDTRERLGRLQRFLQQKPDQIGLGIDESTAVLMVGSECTVMGKRGASLCEERSVKYYKAGQNFRIFSLR